MDKNKESASTDEQVLESILEKIVLRKTGKLMDSESRGKKLELDVVDPGSPHGVYVYDKKKDKWILERIDGEAFTPDKDGFYVIYFDNTRCPACRIYDLYWYPYVKLFGSSLEDVTFVIILCDWFAHKCDSEAAKKSFKQYDIHASPTTMLMYVSNGRIKDVEKVEGVKTIDKLVELVESFIKRNKAGEKPI